MILLMSVLGVLKSRKGAYFDGSNTTNRILDVLEENRPKIICIDELDKMPKQFQDKLLSFMESGYIKVDQIRKLYDFRIKGAKVFAACNVQDHHDLDACFTSIHGRAISRSIGQSIAEVEDCSRHRKSSMGPKRRYS